METIYRILCVCESGNLKCFHVVESPRTNMFAKQLDMNRIKNGNEYTKNIINIKYWETAKLIKR